MKKTIGKNPLSEYLSAPKKIKNEEIKVEQKSVLTNEKKITPSTTIVNEKKVKQRVTIHISTNLIERIKNAVYWEPGLTVAGFCEESLTKAIDKLEKEKGAIYPSRKEQLRGGRPIK